MADPRSAPGFIGLNQYLNANQDAVGNTANGLTSDATTAGQKATTEANSVYSDATNAAFGQGHQVTDPTSLADYSQAQSDAATAQQQLGGLSTFGGNAQQLQTKYGSTQQGYTGGDRTLDANLQLGSGAGQAKVQAAQNQFGNLQGYLDGQVARANTNFNDQAGTTKGGGTGLGGQRLVGTNAPTYAGNPTGPADTGQTPSGWVNPAMPDASKPALWQGSMGGGDPTKAGNAPIPADYKHHNPLPWDGFAVSNWFAKNFPVFGSRQVPDPYDY